MPRRRLGEHAMNGLVKVAPFGAQAVVSACAFSMGLGAAQVQRPRMPRTAPPGARSRYLPSLLCSFSCCVCGGGGPRDTD
jgi:hypothetical protein